MKKLIPVLLFITIAPIAQGYEKKLDTEILSNSEEEIYVEGIYDQSKKIKSLVI